MYTSSPAHGEEVYHDLSYITLTVLSAVIKKHKHYTVTGEMDLNQKNENSEPSGYFRRR